MTTQDLNVPFPHRQSDRLIKPISSLTQIRAFEKKRLEGLFQNQDNKKIEKQSGSIASTNTGGRTVKQMVKQIKWRNKSNGKLELKKTYICIWNVRRSLEVIWLVSQLVAPTSPMHVSCITVDVYE